MKKTFAIFFSPGPAWRAGKTSREQPYWTEHAAFMEKLFEDGLSYWEGLMQTILACSSSLKLSMRKKCRNSLGRIRLWYTRLSA